MTVTRRSIARPAPAPLPPLELVICDVCRDSMALGMSPDEDAAWFAGRHPAGDHQPPSLRPAKGKR